MKYYNQNYNILLIFILAVSTTDIISESKSLVLSKDNSFNQIEDNRFKKFLSDIKFEFIEFPENTEIDRLESLYKQLNLKSYMNDKASIWSFFNNLKSV